MTSAPEPAIPAEAKRRARRQPPTVRRQDLLAVTIRCLAELGPRGATGREICRQAGVSHGLLRHYFNNPDNLLIETYQQLCDQFLERIERELPAAGDPWESLDGLFHVLFDEEWASSEVLGAWMAFWTLVRNGSEFAKVSEGFNARLRVLLETAAQRLPRSGAGLPMEDAVSILSAVMDGLWLEFCLAPERTPRARAVALCSLTARQLFPG